jgi:Tol biopolymer transport system component
MWRSIAAAVLGLSLVATAACGEKSAARPPTARIEFDEPWDSPAAVERARRGLERSAPPHRFPEHGYDDGIAVAPGGAILASATPRQPVNALDIVDLRSGSGWRLVHPDARVGLLDPAFSPDGSRLAFVVGLPSPAAEFTGVSGIWVVDLAGKVQRVISSPGRLYRRPIFSHDGKRLAFARDVFEPAAGFLPRRPENRSAKPQSPFEVDLESGAERRLSAERYQLLRPVNFVPSGDKLFFQASTRMIPVEPGSAILVPDEAYWKASPQPPAPVPLDVFQLNLLDGAVEAVGPTWAHIPSRGPGALLTVRPDSAAVLFDAQVERGDQLAWSIFAANESTTRRLSFGRQDRYLQEAATSPWADAFAGVLTSSVRKNPTFDVDGFIFGPLNGSAEPQRLPYKSIAFRRELVMLDKSLPPTGR